MRNSRRLSLFVPLIFLLLFLIPFSATALAAETGPQWTVTGVSAPTNFTPGNASGEDAYRVQVTNTGAAASDGEPVTISDILPEGLALASVGASGIDQIAVTDPSLGAPGAKFKCVLSSCTFTGVVVPEDTLIVTFPVDVLLSEPGSVTNLVRVSGGGAPGASVSTPTTIAEEPAAFGVSPGSASTALSSVQAGAHPDITTSVAFNTVNTRGSLAGDPDEIVTEEPAGFAGDLVNTPTCAPEIFAQLECPIDTQIGITTLTIRFENESVAHTETQPVYNLAPNPGEVAKFGFTVYGQFDIEGNVSVRPGDYGLRVAFHNTRESGDELDGVSLTVWGVPAAESHNTWRWDPEGIAHGTEHLHFGVASPLPPVPYFTNPTSCGEPLEATFSLNSWEEPESMSAPGCRSVRSWAVTG